MADVTVIIPTFNGEAYLARILDALALQKLTVGKRAGTFEILIVDSGSSDSTLDIISSRSGMAGPTEVRLHQIPNSEFGHGKTRNVAAKLARGKYLVFLSHDAVPITDSPVGSSWLTNMVAPLVGGGAGSNDVIAVVARHIARPNCPPLLKYEIEGVFDRCGKRDRVTVEKLTAAERAAYVKSATIPADLDTRSFYSDVASATIRDFLLNVIPYRDLPYSEDIAFGRDVLLAGYSKAYQPLAPVEHSNDVTFSEYGKRIFDETLGLRRIGQTRSSLSWGQALARAAYGALRDAPRILRDPNYALGAKVGWLVVNPFWQVRKWSAIHRALRVNLNDSTAVSAHSLEAHRARQN
jgi:rhamnosyltransferase